MISEVCTMLEFVQYSEELFDIISFNILNEHTYTSDMICFN